MRFHIIFPAMKVEDSLEKKKTPAKGVRFGKRYAKYVSNLMPAIKKHDITLHPPPNEQTNPPNYTLED